MSNGATPGKKSLSPLAWVAIGCGVLLVLGIVVMVAVGGFAMFKAKQFVDELEEDPARTMATSFVRLNPELELISTDDDAGTITFRDKTEDEEYTVNFEDLKEGKLSWRSSEGEFSVDASETADGGNVVISGPEGETARFSAGGGQNLDEVPDWVPLYPEATATEGTYSMRSGDTASGAVVCKTDDDVATVSEYYQQLFEDEGYKVSVQTMSSGDGKVAIVTGSSPDGDRTLNAATAIDKKTGQTHVTIQYTGKG